MKKVKLLFAPAIAVSIFAVLIVFSSCEKDDIFVSCDGECSSYSPYSNSHTDYCYETRSICERETGHDCKRCD